MTTMKKPEVRSARMMHQQASTARKMSREELASQIRKMRDRDAEMVTGIFKNLENPAGNGSRGAVRFGYKMYPGQQYEFYELCDGERYTIPRGVARHLNNNCFYREYQQMEGGDNGIKQGLADPRLSNRNGRMEPQHYQMARKIHRYAFHSLEYMEDDADMMPSNLVEVTVSP